MNSKVIIIFTVTQMFIFSTLKVQGRYLGCCNGTLGFASTYDMPCSAMRCCDQMQTVAVYPVNYALGYVFRCMKIRLFVMNIAPQPMKSLYDRFCNNVGRREFYSVKATVARRSKPESRVIHKRSLPARCYRHQEIVASTNETSIRYEPRSCCDGHRFRLKVNTRSTGMIIECTAR